MTSAIQIGGLWKEYVIGGAPRRDTFYESLARAISAPRRRLRELAGRDRHRERFWALRDLSLDVREGEVLGVIGHNGAGKSTLLKILSRITEPTRGRVEIRGRVASLLEVGTGFHPELTGRENIYLNGAILGMSRVEIDRKFDEIVAFAEVDRFLDTPVKRYSSGMHVRLAFAVAAHLEPDVLLVDEVLAVGDASFQRKCLSKLGEVGSQGRTVLFVSHNMPAIQSHCSRCLWIDHGVERMNGDVKEVVSSYLRTATEALSEREWSEATTAPGNERVRIRRVAARAEGGDDATMADLDTPIELSFEFWNLVPDTPLCLSLHVRDQASQIAFNAFPWREPSWHGKPFPRGLFRSTCRIPSRLLNNGVYTVDLFVMRDQREVIFRMPHALTFRVGDVPEPDCGWLGGWPGAVRPFLEWRTELVSRQAPSAADLAPSSQSTTHERQ